jgi:hypothetical protein
MSASCQSRANAPQSKVRLFDHFVGAQENRGWQFDADRPGGFEVDLRHIGHLRPRFANHSGWPCRAMQDRYR